MKRYVLKTKAIARDVEVWMGIDAAAGRHSVTILGADRAVLAVESVENTKVAVTALIRRLPGCRIHAVYEAGPTGYGLLEWLTEAGCEAFMTAPSLIPVQSGNAVKTDIRDSLKLATLLAGGQLTEIRPLTRQQYGHRQLVRSYQQAVDGRGTVTRQIRSLLLFHSIPVPRTFGGKWTRKFQEWLEELQTGDSNLDLVIGELVARRSNEDGAAKRLIKHIAASGDAEFKARSALLQTIPGVGEYTAAALLVEIGDHQRFDSATAFACYTGLTPREHSTGKTSGRRGHITRQGNARLRALLVESAWRWVRGCNHAKAVFQDLTERLRGSKKAIVAMARHLARTVYAMLRKNETYRFSDEAAIAA